MAAGGFQAQSILKCGSPRPLPTGDKLSAVPQSAGGPAQFKAWRLRLIYFC
jgi:hypothetical protein